jgi:arginase family enzyme
MMIKLIGIPFDGNSSFLKGSALAPRRIRQMEQDGSANSFCEHGIEILDDKNYTDLGDIIFTDTNPEAAYHKIKDTIRGELQSSSKIICFGGDHSISFPVIEACSEKFKDLHVLHLDAHADLYDNFDNNPYSHASPFARLMEKKIPKSLTQVGIRTLNIKKNRL